MADLQFKQMKHFIVFLSVLFYSGIFCNPPANDACQLKSDTLKVLTWNVYMLPMSVYHKTNKKGRAKDIVRVLEKSGYDIIILQETFQARARGIISKGLKNTYAFQYGPINRTLPPFHFNGGVFILSKIPLKLVKQIVFKARTDYDKYARKGAMMLEGSKNGKKFQIIGTHIQAGPVPVIKNSQFRQIRNELLDRFAQEGIPQFVCGDLNTNAHEPEKYLEMIKLLGTQDGQLTGEKRFSKSSGTEIDYILIKDNHSDAKLIKRNVVIFNPLNPNIKDLSDHYAIEAFFEL